MTVKIKRIGEALWELEPRPDARVPARVVASVELLPSIREDAESLRQLQNVASLPGIVGAAWAMPDLHMGYGFPIGGVAATDPETGVVSPGGVGYDINCGVRLLAFALSESDLRPRLPAIADALFDAVPCGVGRGGNVQVGPGEMARVLSEGGRWAVAEGFGSADDLRHVEEESRIAGADPERVSATALARGKDQLGTLGSGNHFLELGVVDAVYDEASARVYGLAEGTATLILHSGSRGLGHQVCTDSLKTMRSAMRRHGIEVPDPQLCCVPVRSPEGEAYWGAMNAAVNFAFANRQILAAQAVRALASTLGAPAESLGARTVYEVAHNIAKLETHGVDGGERRVCVHRKGATRAFPPRPSRRTRGLPRGGPAGAHPRRHGALQLRAGGPAPGHGTHLRVELPRGRAADEPHQGAGVLPPPPHRARDGEARHPGAVGQPAHPGRGGRRRLQGRG